MPKKAVAVFFLLAFLGAALFIYFTFPRTKDEIPRSNNQQPFLPAPGQNTPNVPNGAPPDLCLVSSRDFSGIDPAEQLDDITANTTVSPRAAAAFTVGGKLKAVPEEFSVEVLFYNPELFDQAGIAYPGSHWNWDMLEADTRALSSLNLKDADGKPTYAIELPANFDLWNILCAEAGTPALDLGSWRLADSGSKDAQMRGLQVLRDLFHQYAITPPLGKNPALLGQYFAEKRAALLIASSDVATTFPSTLHYGMTVLPRDLTLATLASVNGWAVPAKSNQAEAALALAQYLTYRPVHVGWSSMQSPPAGTDDDAPAAVCHAAFAEALVPRLDASTTHMSQFLDQQLNLLAHNPDQTPEVLYARIQAELQAPSSPPEVRGELALPVGTMPAPKADSSSQLRGL